MRVNKSAIKMYARILKRNGESYTIKLQKYLKKGRK